MIAAYHLAGRLGADVGCERWVGKTPKLAHASPLKIPDTNQHQPREKLMALCYQKGVRRKQQPLRTNNSCLTRATVVIGDPELKSFVHIVF